MAAHRPNNDKRKLLHELLSVAFPTDCNGKPPGPISHDDCVQLRSRLISLRHEDLPIALREVMEDLLDTHTNRAGHSEDAEAVVQYLNVLIEGTDLEFIRKQWGEEALEKTISDETILREDKVGVFSSFTKEQARAISMWLEEARNWTDLKWYTSEIDAALAYWKTRCR